MDIFRVRDRLIEDYREFTGSFVDIHDKAIREHVADRMANGYQWPDPWLSLNPSFASGGTVTELIGQGLLQPGTKDIFRLPNGQELRLHKHQKEAVEAARTGKSYVLTTGTGSGKSLAYIVPIVDKVLRSQGHRNVPAGHQGDRRLPDERPGQQPARRAGEVPGHRQPAGDVRAVHRAGVAGRSAPASSRTRRTSCSPTT